VRPSNPEIGDFQPALRSKPHSADAMSVNRRRRQPNKWASLRSVGEVAVENMT
jgi:hypothetical protein